MTDEEMVETLDAVLQALPFFEAPDLGIDLWVTQGLKDVKAALEAEPLAVNDNLLSLHRAVENIAAAKDDPKEPLAVVEGWLDEWVMTQQENPLAWVNQILHDKPKDSILPLIPVTVTIRKR